MILAIDAGNSRIKWGLSRSDGAWQALGAAPVAEMERLHDDWRALPAPDRIAAANVAGPTVRETLVDLASQWSVTPQWLQSQQQAGGVINRYDNPAQLGVDRWAALVAAWDMCSRECLVVMVGTATTVDVLGADGTFRGGLILPGLGLMKRSLSDNTAGLPLLSGRYVDEPRNTADAIESGCVHAVAGAIERMRARLADDAECIISGGAAQAIMPRLPFQARWVEHLVLEGVVRLAK